MIISVLTRIGFIACIGLMLCACTTQPQYDYTAFKTARPVSILVMPPRNLSPDVKATHAVLAHMTYPLAEAGYYVVPITLMETAFRENGIYTADDAQAISPEKLHSIFGADAVLYTNITEYGSSYKLITTETAVTVYSRLVDLKTGTLLWEGSARASSAEQQNNNANNGFAALLIQAAVQQIVNNIVDDSYRYAGIASDRLLTPRSGGILYGPRSPLYEKDGQR